MKMCYLCGIEPRSGKSSYCKEHTRSYFKEYNLINKSVKKPSCVKTQERNAAYVAVHLNVECMCQSCHNAAHKAMITTS